MFKHLLVPTDGSRLSQDTAARAVTFAKEFGSRITFFCAEKRTSGFLLGVGTLPESGVTEYQGKEDSAANKVLDACMKVAEEAGIPSSKLIFSSDEPYAAIIAAAEKAECDLIFMASHGRRGIRALLIGSETQKVLTHSAIPVLVYR